MSKIAFVGVGRGKHSWVAEINTNNHPDVVGHDLYLQVRKHGGLMSREVEVEYDEETFAGRVLVGGYRPVGTFGPMEAA